MDQKWIDQRASKILLILSSPNLINRKPGVQLSKFFPITILSDSPSMRQERAQQVLSIKLSRLALFTILLWNIGGNGIDTRMLFGFLEIAVQFGDRR